MDNFNIQKFFKDQYIAEGSCGYTPDGEPRNKPAGPNEAEAIGLSPGEMKKGDDGKMYNVKASNSERKMAMRSIVDILRDELDVNVDDAFDYIRTHKEDYFNGTVDAFNKEEVVDDYNEYASVNFDYKKDLAEISFGAAGTDKRSGQVIGEIIQMIRDTGIDPSDVLEEVGQEFGIAFEFGRGQ